MRATFVWAFAVFLLAGLVACGGSSSRAASFGGGAILPTSWGSGRYSACPAQVSGSGFSGEPGPNCRQGAYANGRIALPPGPWAITVSDPGGCKDGSPAQGGTFARVPKRGWIHVAGVSAEACS